MLTLDDLEKVLFSQLSLIDDDASLTAAERAFVQTKEALQRGDADFFARMLPKKEHYRIALSYPRETIFVDIESTGLSHYYDLITLIGIGSEREYFCHVMGQDKAALLDRFSSAKCLVTFNGTLFDTKFILKAFPEAVLPSAHVDLRFSAKGVGLSGGQKFIEAEIGIDRASEISNVSGERAPLLWHEYRLGSWEAGKELVRYNHADIEGMKYIFDEVVSRITVRDQLPINNKQIYKFSGSISAINFTTKKNNKKRNTIYIPRPTKALRPKTTYETLVSIRRGERLRIVGIDLTGSEGRPTGWALLDGNQASTQRINSDFDLISETLLALPDLVSIDSPLSIPRGRLRVTDDDPGRDEFGIMRECERILKKRGVNVYPSLIPSMQRLTERGMRLASFFRKLGVPVIESYPGAAQDIMNIPRKRSGLEYLKKGLSDFGIEGGYLWPTASHDEVDAVTSAVVGLFFWSGQFEALGNSEEDYLIIPDLSAPHPNWNKRVVIGLSGPISAGKTTAGEYIGCKFGFEYTRFSQVIDRHLEAEGIPPSRESRQEFGQTINEKLGQRWLCKQVVGDLADDQNFVIDGLRFPEDHAFLVETFGPGFHHLHIDSAESTRKKRYVKNGFKATDFESAKIHHVEQKVMSLRQLAEETLANDDKLLSFRERIHRVVNDLMQRDMGGPTCP